MDINRPIINVSNKTPLGQSHRNIQKANPSEPNLPTPSHSSTAVTDRDVPATIQHSTTMQELQSRAATNETANFYLHHLQPVTPVNVACLKHELQNHPSALFVSNLLKVVLH